MSTTFLGLTVGLGLALTVGRLLHEVSPADPLVLMGSTAFLGAAAMLAAYLPIRGASRIEPTAAPRHE